MGVGLLLMGALLWVVVRRPIWILRPLLACRWIEAGRGVVPMEFAKLVDGVEISAELRGMYVLFYVSTNQARDGKFRKLEVKVVGRDGYRVRVKRGFTAPLGDSLL